MVFCCPLSQIHFTRPFCVESKTKPYPTTTRFFLPAATGNSLIQTAICRTCSSTTFAELSGCPRISSRSSLPLHPPRRPDCQSGRGRHPAFPCTQYHLQQSHRGISSNAASDSAGASQNRVPVGFTLPESPDSSHGRIPPGRQLRRNSFR